MLMRAKLGIRVAALALLLWPAAGVQAQSFPSNSASGKGPGPRMEPIMRVEVAITNRAGLDLLVQAGYDVESAQDSRVLLYADSDELESLLAAGWTLNVLPPPPASPAGPSPKALGAYNNYASMTAMLDGYATNYPALCRKLSLGKSVQGRDLWAIKITSNPDVPADKPKFKYISTIHGNEPLGTEMCLYLIDLLVKGYGSNDTRLVNVVNNVETWIVPLINPDGRESSPPQRYSANGYDLNRSFPEGSGTDLGNVLYGPSASTNGLQPEVGSVMAWTTAHNFSLGANFHTGSLVENYPYDNDGLGSVFSPSPDEALFKVLARAYASNNPPMWANTDFSQHFTNGIVNGADWYAVIGGLQDWSYRYMGSLETTIELSDEGPYSGQWPDPPASELPTYWAQNRESMLQYLEWVLRGVRGLLRDAQTGQPVKGTVRVEGMHHLVFSGPDVGDYHRILLPGNYTLWFYAPGYVPQRIPNVVVGSGPATRLDVALQPVSPRFSAKINFQTAGAAVPSGFRADSGAAFASRGAGYTYGWETTLPSGDLLERKAGRSQDLRYDTLCQMQAGGSHVWEMAVPNGPYSVLLAAGDPSFTNGLYRILAENVPILDGAPTAGDPWVEGLGTVVVTDGRLTLSSGSGAISNRLAFLEVSAVEPSTIAQWRALYFGTTNNSGAAANNADPDNDGIPNLLEYAFGLNPTNLDQSSPLSPVVVRTNNANWFGCSFFRNTNAPMWSSTCKWLGCWRRRPGARWRPGPTAPAGPGLAGLGKPVRCRIAPRSPCWTFSRCLAPRAALCSCG